jgi:putative FmdB family regulatory protein
MPLYEYYCANCTTRFEALRAMSQSNAPITCPRCADANAQRVVSTFAAISKSDGGGSRLVAGSQGGGCGSCSGGHCATCGH